MDLLCKDVLYEIFLFIINSDFCRKEVAHGPCKTLMLVCKKWYYILKIKTVRMEIVPFSPEYGYYLFVETRDRSIATTKKYVVSDFYKSFKSLNY